MNFLKQIFNWLKAFLPNDKLEHYFWSANLSFVVLPFAYHFSHFYALGSYISILIILAAKEVIWDGLMKKGNPELKDFLIGAVAVTQVYLTIILL